MEKRSALEALYRQRNALALYHVESQHAVKLTINLADSIICISSIFKLNEGCNTSKE